MENSRDIDGASHGRQALIANAFRTTVDGCAVAMRPGGPETWPMATDRLRSNVSSNTA